MVSKEISCVIQLRQPRYVAHVTGKIILSCEGRNGIGRLNAVTPIIQEKGNRDSKDKGESGEFFGIDSHESPRQ